MKALVTGANGFLGHHLLEQLAQRKIQTITVTRKPFAGHQNQKNIVLPNPEDPSCVQNLLKEVAPTLIFHLAGLTGGPSVDAIYRANVIYATNLFNAVERLKASPVIVLAGSASEYGNIGSGRNGILETQRCEPVTIYGISKLAQTLHGLAAIRQGTPVIVARLFNLIGSGMPEHLALGSFARQIASLDGGILLKTGNLDAERDFVEVSECARLLVDLALQPKAIGEIVNICTGIGWNMRDLTRRLAAIADPRIYIEESPDRKGNSSFKSIIGSPEKLHSYGLSVMKFDMDRILTEVLAGIGKVETL